MREEREAKGGIKLLQWITESSLFKNFILACIVANAATLGIEAHFGPANPWRAEIAQLDTVFLAIFTAELILEFLAQGPRRYVRDGWNLFDVAVVSASYAAITAFSALRVLRVLRVLRLFSNIAPLRRVIEALIGAMPGMAAAMMVLGIVFYVGAVMATTLFGASHPIWFGDLGASALTLFQLTQFDGWGDLVRDLNGVHPLAWMFFILFTVVAAFAVLNLFIGVIVDAVQDVRALDAAKAADEDPDAGSAKVAAVHQRRIADLQRETLDEVRALRAELAALKTEKSA
jgi:voltage-gated sodium channel